MVTLPARAGVVIVGGGIVGCSVAYHLAKRGCTDVVLLERKQLTCGTTWHAAGLVGQLRATHNLTGLAKYTTDLFATLEDETEQATGFMQRGSIAVATNDERFEELKRGASMARLFGLEVDVITAADIQALVPLAYVDDLVGGVLLPNDGQTNPIDTTQALAKGARSRGVRIVENVKVNKIVVEDGRAVGVSTDAGDIRADAVVNCAGMWARELADGVGAVVPLHAAEHFYIVTEHIEALSPTMPVLRDPDGCGYFKEDAGKLLVGWFEPVAKPWGMTVDPRVVLLRLAAGGLRTHRAADGSGNAPHADPRRERHPIVLQRPRVLHARRPLPPRRIARRPPGCSSPQDSTRSASSRRAAPARCWPTGSSTGIRRWTCGTSTCAG